MKEDHGVATGRVARAGPVSVLRDGGSRALEPRRSAPSRAISVRVLIRPARPDDLEEATLHERRIRGRMAATLNEMQRRLFAFPEAFLIGELRRPGCSPQIIGIATGLIWTREYPRSYTDYETVPPSASHNPRGEVLFIASIGVDPVLRGHGVGLRLLQEAVEVGRRRHLKLTRLISNSRSQPLFERAGFLPLRSLPRLYRQHRDLMPSPVLMELPLV